MRLNLEAILTGICKSELTATQFNTMQLNEHTRKNKVTKLICKGIDSLTAATNLGQGDVGKLLSKMVILNA